MPTSVTRYKIFLASPSDLAEERSSIEDVISELNLTYGRQHDIVLELLKWESHSAPGISLQSSQEIINSDIGNDYDIFIGLIWKKFGTATEKANSGTEEEFLNAFNRFITNPDSVQILFYFKNSPVSISEIDVSQIEKIQKFKSDVGKNKKLLYWEYQDIQQLHKFLRIHIPQRISEMKNIHKSKTIEEPPIKDKIKIQEIYQEELGVLDYQEMVEDYLAESTQSLVRISEATNWIGDQLNKKTTEIQSLGLNGNIAGRNEIKGILKRTSKVMDNYASRIDPEISIFYDNFEKAIDCYSNLINIYKSDLDINNLEDTKTSLGNLITAINESSGNMEDFLESVKALPRLSKDLNNAKANVSQKLEKLVTNMNISHTIAVELHKRFDE